MICAISFTPFPLRSYAIGPGGQASTFILARNMSKPEMHTQQMISQQINQIRQAMQQAGKWTSRPPEWVYTYHGGSIPDIWEWLQFIYLPMRMGKESFPPHLVAPLLAEHVQTRPELEQILSLVIELDNLSPTIENRQ